MYLFFFLFTLGWQGFEEAAQRTLVSGVTFLTFIKIYYIIYIVNGERSEQRINGLNVQTRKNYTKIYIPIF